MGLFAARYQEDEGACLSNGHHRKMGSSKLQDKFKNFTDIITAEDMFRTKPKFSLCISKVRYSCTLPLYNQY